MFAHIRLANKKGLLQGRLNVIQEEALQWIMIDEIRNQIALEKERMKYTVLAGNIQLWQHLFGNEEDEDLPPDDQIEWIRPESAEDIEQMLALLEAGDRATETF